ncbi:hypothetical protein BYT27DRAFT_6480098 [Phlegmacium glaucopus]|nr:hypothetical protein BYT27DRAFT_6480098 [Phlegmacium glaucopus]
MRKNMSVQIFPAEILDLFLDELGSATEDMQSQAALLACALVNRQFYYQASSSIFSSLTISNPNRLDGLLDILNTNPGIARHIRSFTVKHQPSSKCLSAVFRQLRHLQEFGWIGRPTLRSQVMLTAITLSISSLCSHLPYLTVLHFEDMTNFPLSLFSSCRHLESLTLLRIVFAEIQQETLSGSLFPSLKRLSLSGPWSKDDGGTGIIMTHAAPTLTTLILCDPPHGDNARFFLNFKSTIVFPVLESIQVSFTMHLYGENSLGNFLSRFLEHSTPMLAQIQIEIPSGYGYTLPRMQQPLAKGPIDEILSSPRDQDLKTLDLVFLHRSSDVAE